ncbi:MBL fold metallo-hydrolase [Jeotgalibacillus soli]|uniref:Rhodanese domain-containing protein n=1 Tax=Jeotgalibacillus soli TaxID=889306 RepID=A0A0C2VT46_9BACL|nr:rhodanese-like domain-containing protein [Jeotgalibacillus soli]KIL52097.1 hypothetical protein KP78_04670 [Jeotgalibacillus soli]
MLLRTFFDEKLAQYAYLVGCQRTGEAIIIDPPRNVKTIVQEARKEGLMITAAAETHIHADFASGARQLAVEYGSTLYLSDEGDENWKYQYTDGLKAVLVKDGSLFNIGNIRFDVMHTPGHTPESISYIVTDLGGGATDPMGIFTGDFVFVGDIGRPDLLEKSAGAIGSAKAGAHQMFHSLKRFKELPDYLTVWPGHGAGSACGKSLGAVPQSTVGYEKRFNWAMSIENEEGFVTELLKDQPEAPSYFAQMKKVNNMGPDLIKDEPIVWETDAVALEVWSERKGNIILDTRPSHETENGLIPGSINIPFGKILPNWAGWLINYDEDITLIVKPEQAEEALIALRSIHLDRVVKLADPAIIQEAAVVSYETLTTEEFAELKENTDVQIIDVRNDSEWQGGRIAGTDHKMLGHLRKEGSTLDPNKPLLIHCQSGARSAIAASVMLSLGFKNVKHLAGGFNAWVRDRSNEVVTS